MNRKTKTRMLVLSVVFLALGATVTFASSNNDVLKVHTILNNAIQDIQRIYFSSGAVKDVSHPEYEIPVLVQNGSVSMGGRMLMTTSGANNVLAKGSTGSSLFEGRNNVLSGVDSYIVAGSGNRIYQDVTGGVIIGGTENIIYQGENSYILGGSSNIIWSGNNSFIIGGKNGQITGNNSYIFMGNGSNQNKSAKINANNVVTFGKNVNIDKDNVFLWRDHSTTDEKSAKRENTFIMFAKNGLNILKNTASSASFVATGAVKVEGSLQLSGEEVRCGKSIGGAVQYTGGMNGCFCGCNGTGWVSLVPSDRCRDVCPKITGRSFEDGKCIEVPAAGLESLENNDSACDEGTISGYNQIDAGGFPASWTWECIGDNGSNASCSAIAFSGAGKCFEGEGTVGEGDRYHCFKGKVTNEKDENNKYTWDCEPINKPKEGNTEKCAVCHNGYTYMEGSETCERTTETKCINEANDFLCTNGGTPTDKTQLKVSVSGVIIGGKWNCVSPTGGTGENGCHWCDSSKDYEWSGGANNCVLKKKGVCANNPIPVNNSSAWCTIGSVEVVTQNHSTQSYAWYCKGENAGDDVNFKSNLCTYCANGGTYNTDSGKCEVEDTDYCRTKGVHHVGNSFIVSNGTQCVTIADKNVGATILGGVGKYYKWGAISSSQIYPAGPNGSDMDCDGGLFLDCHWGWGGRTSPCDGMGSVPGKQDWLKLYEIWSDINSSNTFSDDLKLPYVGYYYENELKNNGKGYYWTDESRNRAEAGGMVMNGSSVQFNDKLDGQYYGLQVRCFGEGDHQQSTDIPEDPDTFQGEWACLDGGDVSGICGEISSSLFCDKFKQKYRNTCYIMDGHGIMQFRHDGGACDACVYTPPSYCNSIPSNKPMPPECSVLVPLENNCSTKTDAILCEKTYSCGWFHNGAVYDFPTEPVCIDPVTKEELSELDCDLEEEPESCPYST